MNNRDASDLKRHYDVTVKNNNFLVLIKVLIDFVERAY